MIECDWITNGITNFRDSDKEVDCYMTISLGKY